MKRILALVCFFTALRAAEPEIVFAPGEMESIKGMMRGLIRETFEDLVTDPLFGHRILKDRFYFFTKPFRRRDLIDQCPISQISAKRQVSFFYQETHSSVYTQTKTALDSFVDIKQEGLIEALEDLPKFDGLDLPEVLSLFAPVRTQERRIGLMLNYKTQWRNWGVEFSLPVLYQEYNFYLTPAERAAISSSDLFKLRVQEETTIEDGPKEKPKGKGVSTFIRDHLLSDKLGIADLHILFETELRTFSQSSVTGGVNITIPTGFAFKKGLVGKSFNKEYPTPKLDLHRDIVDLETAGQRSQLKQNIIDFGVAALDRLATVVLEHPIGNNHHPGVAPFFKLIFNSSKGFTVTGQIRSDFLLPIPEQRFFKKIVDQAALDASADSDPITEEEARVQVDFLSAQLLEKLFPESYSVVVFPGVILQSDLVVMFQARRWIFETGIQSWYQSAEQFLGFGGTFADSTLDKEAGRRYAALQTKLWGAVSKQGDGWGIKIVGSGTPLSFGIGKTFCIGLTCSWEF